MISFVLIVNKLFVKLEPLYNSQFVHTYINWVNKYIYYKNNMSF